MKTIVTMALLIAVLINPISIAGGETMFDNVTIKQCTPDNYSLEAAIDLGLANSDSYSDEYFRLQAYYAEALVAYVDQAIGLRQLDDELAENSLRLIARETPANIYQETGAFGMKYLFLRSNICIERLNAAEIQTLREAVQDGRAVTDEDIQMLTGRTFVDVTRLMPDKKDELEIILEPDGKSAPNRGVIFGLATRFEYDENGKILDAAHEKEKNGFIDFMLPELSQKLSESLGTPVTILKY